MKIGTVGLTLHSCFSRRLCPRLCHICRQLTGLGISAIGYPHLFVRFLLQHHHQICLTVSLHCRQFYRNLVLTHPFPPATQTVSLTNLSSTTVTTKTIQPQLDVTSYSHTSILRKLICQQTHAALYVHALAFTHDTASSQFMAIAGTTAITVVDSDEATNVQRTTKNSRCRPPARPPAPEPGSAPNIPDVLACRQTSNIHPRLEKETDAVRNTFTLELFPQ